MNDSNQQNMLITGEQIIGFNCSKKSLVNFQTCDPVSGRLSEIYFFEATNEEIEDACALADIAFEEFQSVNSDKRADFLLAIAEELDKNETVLLKQYSFESGLSYDRAVVEKNRTVHQLRAFADHVRSNRWLEVSIDTADEKKVPATPDLRKFNQGIGPVVVFGASNFPLAYSTAGGDTVAAFAAGCPVIVKAHPLHAGTGEIVARSILEAAKKTGMPNGVFSNLNAQSFEVGKKLVLDPRIKAIGFTGSISGGRALYDLAAQRVEPIPVFAEMGSVNPVVVLPNKLKENLEHWTTIYADSITSSAGQFCTKPGLIFLTQSDNSDEFIQRLGQKVVEKDASVMLNASIHAMFEQKRAKAKDISPENYYEKQGDLPVNFARQSVQLVTGDQFLKESSLADEVFGPFSLVVLTNDLSELIACLNALNGQLTGSILGDEDEIKDNPKILSTLKRKVGRVIFNGVPTGVTVCPSMHHGGPYPASTDSRFTAVGIDSMKRFLRPVVYQNCSNDLLPVALKDENSLGISRRVNDQWTKSDIISKKI